MQKIDYTSYEKPSDFIKFKQGATVIRIVSSGAFLMQHSIKTGERYIPLGECVGSGCAQCAKGNEPKKTWMWVALNRDSQRLGVLQVGSTLGNGICLLAQKEEKDPKEFDLIVTRTGEGKATKYTVVRKSVNDDLTEQEHKIISDNKKYLINKYFGKDENSTRN